MAPSDRGAALDQAVRSLGQALEGLDPHETITALRLVFGWLGPRNALSLAVAAALGDSPEREVAVIDPETGNVRAYLVPPDVAIARWAAWSREQSGPDRPPISLDEFRELVARGEPRASVGTDPSVAVPG